MNRYFFITKNAFLKVLTYRLSVFAFRFGAVLEILLIITMWMMIFKTQTSVSGLTRDEMISYVIIGNIITSFTRNLATDVIARDITDGSLSLFLIRPLSYFNYCFFREIGRTVLPLVVSLFFQILIIVIWFKAFIISPNFSTLLVIVPMVGLSFLIELGISFLAGLIAFWTDEVSGIFSIITTLKRFLSGSYFPLSLLPPLFTTLSFLLPFAYSFYIPTQLYLGKMSITQGLQGLAVQVIWIALLYGLIKLVWKRGLRKYEGVGI